MVKPTLTSTSAIKHQSPSRSSFLFPRPQSLRCIHTTTPRPRTAPQSIPTRQPAQASPTILAKQQYLRTRIKDLGILPGMFPLERSKHSSFFTSLLKRESENEKENEDVRLRVLYVYYRNFYHAYWWQEAVLAARAPTALAIGVS